MCGWCCSKVCGRDLLVRQHTVLPARTSCWLDSHTADVCSDWSGWSQQRLHRPGWPAHNEHEGIHICFVFVEKHFSWWTDSTRVFVRTIRSCLLLHWPSSTWRAAVCQPSALGSQRLRTHSPAGSRPAELKIQREVTQVHLQDQHNAAVVLWHQEDIFYAEGPNMLPLVANPFLRNTNLQYEEQRNPESVLNKDWTASQALLS